MRRKLIWALGLAASGVLALGCEKAFGVRLGDPARVADLAVVGVGKTDASLRWTEVANGAKEPATYLLYVGSPAPDWPADPGLAQVVVGDSVGRIREVAVDGLERATDYSAYVVSVRQTDDSVFFSNKSATVEFTTLSDDPEQVTGITASMSSASTARFVWPQVDDGLGGLAKYAVVLKSPTASWSADSASAVQVGGFAAGASAEYNASGLSPSTQYQLIVASLRGTFGSPDAVLGPPSEPFTLVTPAAPPPPPPGSSTPFFTDDFESGGKTNANGFTWGTAGSRAMVVNDRAVSGSFSLRMRYGPDTTNQDSNSEQRFNMGRNLAAVWIEYQLFVPTNFTHRAQSSSTNNKFLMIWNTTYGSGAGTWQAGYEYNRTADGWSTLRPMSTKEFGANATFVTSSQLGHPDQGKNFIGPTFTLKPGQWHLIRLQFQRSSAGGATDGIMRMWIDGVLYASMTNGPFRNLDNVGETVLRQGYFMGWSNSGFEAITDWYIDDVKFYDVDPGWPVP